MMLTAKQAADLALKHGLDLTAASALSRMNLETAEEADAIAAAFADPKPRQLTREDIKGMAPEAILKAKEDGQCADLLGGQS
jgi:hypothetical protein